MVDFKLIKREVTLGGLDPIRQALSEWVQKSQAESNRLSLVGLGAENFHTVKKAQERNTEQPLGTVGFSPTTTRN